MPAKKIIVALFVIVVAIGGFVSGLLLLRQQQDLRRDAAVEDGEATVSISPETGTFEVGDTITSEVRFNTAGIAIDGISVRLNYPYSGNTPEVSVSQIEINPSLLSGGDWTCPTENSSLQGGSVVIDIACSDLSATGFSSDVNTLLATITFEVNRSPASNPVVISFDEVASIVSRKSTGEDILLIPESTATYTIGGQPQATATPTTGFGVTNTPTPTGGTGGDGITPSPTLVTTETPTPTATATATPTSSITKGGEELPDAGVSYPTILGIGVGTLIIIGSLVLAL